MDDSNVLFDPTNSKKIELIVEDLGLKEKEIVVPNAVKKNKQP